MPRLPQPGKDAGQWGDILNEYLSTSISSDGTLKTDTVGAPQLKPNSVTHAALAPNAVTKADVGLSNVDNTGDADKPISTAVQTALNTKVDNAEFASELSGKVSSSSIGTADGIAGLDADAKLPEVQAPTGYMRDVTGRRIDISVPAQAGGHSTAFMSRIAGGRESASMLVMGDSTGDETNVSGRWVLRTAQWLANKFPEYTVNFRQWNYANNVFDSLGTGKSTVVHVGSGTGNNGVPYTIDIWNHSASGMAPSYHLSNSRAASAITLASPQLIIINHGHNIGSASGSESSFQIGRLARASRDLAPRAGIMLTAQNIDGPLATDYAKDFERARHVQHLAAMDGYGLVNVFQLYRNNPNYLSEWISAADGLWVHPSSAGSEAWAGEVIRQLWAGANPTITPLLATNPQDRIFIPARSFDIAAGNPSSSLMPDGSGIAWSFASGQSNAVVTTIMPPAHWLYYEVHVIWSLQTSSGFDGSKYVNWGIARQQMIGSATMPHGAYAYPLPAYVGPSYSACVPSNGGGGYQTQVHALSLQSTYAVGAAMHLRIHRSASDTIPETAYLRGVLLTRNSTT